MWTCGLSICSRQEEQPLILYIYSFNKLGIRHLGSLSSQKVNCIHFIPFTGPFPCDALACKLHLHFFFNLEDVFLDTSILIFFKAKMNKFSVYYGQKKMNNFTSLLSLHYQRRKTDAFTLIQAKNNIVQGIQVIEKIKFSLHPPFIWIIALFSHLSSSCPANFAA